MAETEVRSELSLRETKRCLEEEEKEDDIDDDGSYRSDDSDYETDRNPQPGRRIWNRYMRECRESEGFDITVFPGSAYNATVVPMMLYLNIPEEKQKYTDLCTMAIQKFNSERGKNYVFVDFVSVNGSFAAGVWYYFTFRAEDKTEGLKIFQALVWDGVGGDRDVEFCRLKKNLGDEETRHSNVDKGCPRSSVDAEAVQLT